MTFKPLIAGRRFAIASGHPLASMAGAEIIHSGGNAIDAGVAAGIALSVLESNLVSFAGVAPIILYSAEKDEMITISGLGTWPQSVDAEYFNRLHEGRIPAGILRTVVPAAPDAWITALARYGRMGFAEVSEFAIDFARNGFHVYEFFRDRITEKQDAFAKYPSSAALYLPGGKPPEIGTLFRNTKLADSMQFLADEDRGTASKGGREAGLSAARAAFYEGDMAKEMVSHVRESGGELSLEDLRDFSVSIEPPTAISFGDWQVNACGPWCQGPMLLQTLKLLEGFDLRSLQHNSPDYVHLLCETLKLAARDRDRYFGDPQFVDVPLSRLLSEVYSKELGRRIRWDQVLSDAELGYNETPLPEEDASALDTSYVCAVDKNGNAFSATPSDGSYHVPVSPKLGFIVSARGSQSWADTNHPASVAPGKRPRLTPNPAMAVGPDGRILPFGSPGGDVQTQAMLQAFLNHVVFEFDPQTATELPRFASYDFPSSFEPHERQPGVVKIERSLDEKVGADLMSRGHKVVSWPDQMWIAGSVSMVDFNRRTGQMVAGSDFRREAFALGW